MKPIAVFLLLSGCALGRDYQRPAVAAMSSFRGQDRAEAASFADLPWWQVFHDEALAALINEALQNSYDLAEAVARREAARENAAASAGALFPSVGVRAGPAYQQTFSPFTAPGRPSGNLRYETYTLQATSAWEIDLWGRLRRLREAALADFLASEQNRRGVIVSLVGDVAAGYFNLVALDLQLDVARQTVAARQQTLQLFVAREAGGVGDGLDTASEQASLANAAAQIPSLERQITRLENQLCVLLGRTPGPIRRTRDFFPAPAPPMQPAGLPAKLLERRPDVRAAEAQVMAANAQVGAAYAALFPTISLAASAGFESTSLSNALNSNALIYALAPLASWVAPVLNGAQNRHRHRAQEATLHAVIAQYRRTILTALGDVADAVTDIHQLGEQRAQLDAEVRARNDSVRLAKVRFTNGVASYLDVVQAEQNLFPAQIALAQTIGAQFVAVTQLYRALGGGWQ
jgi:multidrug efflux system outer membrane protein